MSVPHKGYCNTKLSLLIELITFFFPGLPMQICFMTMTGWVLGNTRVPTFSKYFHEYNFTFFCEHLNANKFCILLEWKILSGHPSSCVQSEGPWREGHCPGHRNGDRPAVHDGCDCWGWLLLCCGGTDGGLLKVDWTLKHTHMFTSQFHFIANVCIFNENLN